MSTILDNVNVAPATATETPKLRVEIDVTTKPTLTPRVWTDVTSFVRDASYTLAGRSTEREATQPGSFTLTLNNNPHVTTGRPFDRDNTLSPYYPGLSWSFWVRFSALFQSGVYVRLTGVKQSLPKTRPHAGKDNVATVQGADAMKPLELFGLGGLALAQSQAGGRITDILTAANIPAGTIDPGWPRLVYPAVTFAEGDSTSGLSHLQQIEQDERGLLFARSDGKIEFQGRYYRALLTQAGPLATIGESAGQIRYIDGDFNDAGEFRFNSVSVTPAGGTAAVSKDTASIAEAFELRLPLTMLSESPSQALGNAQWYRHRYSTPAQRVGPLPIVGARSPDFWPVILSAQNSDLFLWAASTGSQQVHLERVTEQWTVGEPPRVTWDLSPANRERVWRLGVAGQSEVGLTTRLG